MGRAWLACACACACVSRRIVCTLLTLTESLNLWSLLKYGARVVLSSARVGNVGGMLEEDKYWWVEIYVG